MTAEPSRVPWTPQLIRVMVGLMMSLFVAAMDSTVVGTALPSIAQELGQFQLYSWVFGGYLVTATTTVPVWGRLADQHGRRRVLLAGIGLFVAASVLCGASPGMGWLIAFRTLQGIGAGCIQPLVFTVVGDIFPLHQRARLQGFFSSMWAIAAIVGPALGALFVSTIGWRWIFVINLPIGVIAAALFWGYAEKRPAEGSGAILSLRSPVLLTAGIALLLWGLGTGSQVVTPNWPALALAALALLGFGVAEARARAPLLPLELLRHPVIGPAVLVAALGGIVMFGVTAYVPLFVQEVLGGTPYAAGASVGAMSISWPVASAIAGWNMVRIGYQRLVVAGALSLVAGTLILALAPDAAGIIWMAVGSLVIGCGMGLFSAPLLIVIQSSVEWARRGAATAMNQFSRTIGGAVGVSILGIVLQGFVGSAGDPLAAHSELEAGLRLDFTLLVGLSLLVLGTAVVILRSSLSARVPASAVDQ